jgi:hypothetical protein
MKNKEPIIKIKKVFFRDEKIFFSLEDEREIGSPLKWYPKLNKASEEELMDYSISPGGYGVHWNKIDEDLSAYGMLNLNRDLNTISQ